MARLEQMRFGCLGFLVSLIGLCPTYGYDSMDPNGNITIQWDVLQLDDGSQYSAKVTIYNYQLYRHVDSPGWRYGWAWQTEEVILDMRGAEATEQGDCSKHNPQAHSCEKHPVIVDLLPGTPYNMQYQNCCKGGVLSTKIQDPSHYTASFLLTVSGAASNNTPEFLPVNHTLGLPGYTCGPPDVVPPTRSTNDGRRFTQVAMTWKVTCSYNQYLASPTPTCCVSLSSFYNETLIPCLHCSCNCPGANPQGNKCIEGDKTPSLLQLPHGDGDGDGGLKPVVRCTQHMCPIRVHWHVKLSYRNHWRVKVTVTNFNYVKNYSQWNLVIQQPNLASVNQIFSFNYKPLLQYGDINDTGMFWGINYYNDMLLHAGEFGNVQTEILLRKDPGVFTFDAGWAFPRKVSFNGDECVMPPPDMFPRLPNGSSTRTLHHQFWIFGFVLVLIMLS